MNKYLVECIGTFFVVLTFIGVHSGLKESVLLPPLATGISLMVMIYAGAHVSGGHFNPAVSIAVFIRGKMESKHILPYIVAQTLGGAFAALVSGSLLNYTNTPTNFELAPALVAEFLGAFALAYVVLNVATAKSTMGNNYFGLAIGFTMIAMGYTMFGKSLGVFNPAIAVGACFTNLSPWNNLWVYLLASTSGGALAAMVFGFTYGQKD